MASLTSHPIEAELTPKSSKAPDSPFGSFIPAGSYLRSSRAAALQNPASPRAAYVLAALPEAHIPPPPIRPSAGPRHGTIVRSRSRVFDAATKPAPSYKLKERSGEPVGKWVFIVNGTKLKQWDELSPRLVKQISGAEVRRGPPAVAAAAAPRRPATHRGAAAPSPPPLTSHLSPLTLPRALPCRSASASPRSAATRSSWRSSPPARAPTSLPPWAATAP